MLLKMTWCSLLYEQNAGKYFQYLDIKEESEKVIIYKWLGKFKRICSSHNIHTLEIWDVSPQNMYNVYEYDVMLCGISSN